MDLDSFNNKTIAVIGSRSFDDYKYFESILNKIQNIKAIVSGGARGADTMAEHYAEMNSIPIKIFLPQWDKHGRAAGMVRNKSIVNSADCVIAFWDGSSKGTKHAIEYAKETSKPVLIVNYNQNKQQPSSVDEMAVYYNPDDDTLYLNPQSYPANAIYQTGIDNDLWLRGEKVFYSTTSLPVNGKTYTVYNFGRVFTTIPDAKDVMASIKYLGTNNTRFKIDKDDYRSFMNIMVGFIHRKLIQDKKINAILIPKSSSKILYDFIKFYDFKDAVPVHTDFFKKIKRIENLFLEYTEKYDTDPKFKKVLDNYIKKVKSDYQDSESTFQMKSTDKQFSRYLRGFMEIVPYFRETQEIIKDKNIAILDDTYAGGGSMAEMFRLVSLLEPKNMIGIAMFKYESGKIPQKLAAGNTKWGDPREKEKTPKGGWNLPDQEGAMKLYKERKAKEDAEKLKKAIEDLYNEIKTSERHLTILANSTREGASEFFEEEYKNLLKLKKKYKKLTGKEVETKF